MKPSEELHQLIKSMSMSEKRYFKIHSTMHVIGGTNNYIRLFDSIEQQEVYNEEEIKEKFKGETFIRHLPSEKHYLYNQILESLNSFNRERTFLSRSSNALISIEILYNKGLFDQCLKQISKIKKEAYELEKISALLIILRWETIVYIKQEDGKKINAAIQEEQRLLQIMSIQTPLMQLAFNIQIEIDRGRVSTDYLKKQESELERLFPKDARTNSFWSKYYYHSSRSLIFTVLDKQEERYICYREIKKTMDESPALIKDVPAIYHLNYNNLVNTMLYLGKYKEVESLIREQRMFTQTYGIKSPTFSKTVFLNTYESELYFYYKTGKYDKAAQAVKEIEPEVKKLSPDTCGPIYFDLLYFMAVSEFMVKDYKAAVRWLNKILNQERSAIIRKELQINTRVLYVMALYEMDDILYENRMNAAKRFIANEPHFKTQLRTLEAIGGLNEYFSTGKNKPALKKLVSAIRNEKITREELLNKHFDFAHWIEDKMKE
jgi:tetratricopeptide (TPR) repeat protein